MTLTAPLRSLGETLWQTSGIETGPTTGDPLSEATDRVAGNVDAVYVSHQHLEGPGGM